MREGFKVSIITFVVMAAMIAVGFVLTSPKRTIAQGTPPYLPFEPVSLESRSGATIEGYYAEPEPSGTRAILDLEMEKVRLNVTFESRIKYPILMWWTEGMSLTRGPKKCPGGETCLFTKRKEYAGHPMTKAVFFYGSFFEPESLKLPLPRPQGVFIIRESTMKLLRDHAYAAKIKIST